MDENFLVVQLEIKPCGFEESSQLFNEMSKHVGYIKDFLFTHIGLNSLIKNGSLLCNNDFKEHCDKMKDRYPVFYPMFLNGNDAEYYNEYVSQYYNIYGGVFNMKYMNIKHKILIQVLGIKNHTKTYINSYHVDVDVEKFHNLYLSDTLIRNNIACSQYVYYHRYRMNIMSQKIYENTLNRFLTYNKTNLTNTKLLLHQRYNISKMLYLHNKKEKMIPKDLLHKFTDKLSYNLNKRKFVNIDDTKKYNISGGVLMDEPGTGKTLQFIIFSIETGLDTIVVVPNMQIKQNWINQINIHIKRDINFVLHIYTFHELENNLLLFYNYNLIGIDEFHLLDMKLLKTIINCPIINRWAITGTPFMNDNSLFNILQFLARDEFLNNNEPLYHIGRIPSIQDDFIEFFIKNKKVDMTDYNFPSLYIDNIYVDLDVVQRNIYDTERNRMLSSKKLRLLVSDIELVYDQNDIKTPRELKDIVLNNYRKLYEDELSRLNKLKSEYDDIVLNMDLISTCEFKTKSDTYKNMISCGEITLQKHKNVYDYFLSTISKIVNTLSDKDNYDKDITCPICMSEYEKSITYFTNCGHYFCSDCITNITSTNKTFPCPICRGVVYEDNIIIVNDVVEINYSPKYHETLKIVKKFPNDRIIIFTQYPYIIDKLMKYFNKLDPNNKVQKYNDDVIRDDINVLILSSENNAEGIDLSNFDKMIIYEPFDDTVYSKEVEKQLISRIHRIGRQKDVQIYRLITKNTIEEDIYNMIE